MVIECFVMETSGLAESDFGIIWLAGTWAIPEVAKKAKRLVLIKPVNFLMMSSGLYLNVNHFPNIYNFRMPECINGRNCYTKGTRQSDLKCPKTFFSLVIILFKQYYSH